MTRLLIVDKDGRARHEMASALGTQTPVQVIGVARTIDEALALMCECDLMLVSGSLPDNGALRLVKTVCGQSDAWTKVLLMDVGEREMAPYLAAGAIGWVV